MAAARDSNLVLTVARLEPGDAYKGVDTLVRVWPQVKHHVPSAKLVVVGEGEDRARLESLGRVLDDRSVSFLGRVPDSELDRLYATSTLFALPGRCRLGPTPYGEGFGLVFIEAAARGLAVVAGAGGGVSEAVLDDRTGIVVDGNDDDAVVSALVSLLRDPLRREMMGAEGQRRAQEEFSFDRFRAEVCSVIAAIGIHKNAMPPD